MLWASGGFGDVKHAQALIFLQELILGTDLLSQCVEFVLLHLRAQVDPRHGHDLLARVLDPRPQLVQLLVYILVVFIHAVGTKRFVLQTG